MKKKKKRKGVVLVLSECGLIASRNPENWCPCDAIPSKQYSEPSSDVGECFGSGKEKTR